MSKVMKQKIKLPVGVNTEDLSDLFNQMLGASNPSIHISYPRYCRIKEIISKLMQIINVFNKSPFMRAYDDFKLYQTEIEAFDSRAKVDFIKYFSYDFSAYELNLNAIPAEELAAFTNTYLELKKSDFINTFIVLCDKLYVFKRYLSDINNLDGKFINALGGCEYCPFPFSTFNLKLVYNVDGINELSRTFILNVLHKLYKFSYDLYTEITSPDINVEDIAEIIISNLDQVKRIPELNRCRKAFDKIKNAIDLLKSNFNSYYRDFISTKNSTIMMEHFILDVANNTDSDAQTKREFLTIIAYYRKMAQNASVKDPRVDKLFETLNETCSVMERNTTNLGAKEN